MSWIQTYTSKQFRPLTPEPGAIDIRDIAHALSLQCRFNGHCRAFYSVADHALRVSQILPARYALWGLLHDAAEAYLADLPRPVKTHIPSFVALEEQILRVIARHFDLEWPMPSIVRWADDTLLATEQRDLMGPPPADWGPMPPPLEEPIVPLTAVEAEKAFLARFAEVAPPSHSNLPMSSR